MIRLWFRRLVRKLLSGQYLQLKSRSGRRQTARLGVEALELRTVTSTMNIAPPALVAWAPAAVVAAPVQAESAITSGDVPSTVYAQSDPTEYSGPALDALLNDVRQAAMPARDAPGNPATIPTGLIADVLPAGTADISAGTQGQAI